MFSTVLYSSVAQ